MAMRLLSATRCPYYEPSLTGVQGWASVEVASLLSTCVFFQLPLLFLSF